MPVVSVTLLPGYPPEVQHRLVDHLARATRSVIPAAEAGTTVYVNEASTYRRDGRAYAGGAPARGSASAIVLAFLDAMGRRDLAQAQSHLAEGFTMCFPGPQQMQRLSELAEWAATRYREVRKHYERVEECWLGDTAATTAVYCSGTLEGTWLDGRTFAGIRFIDRFEVAGDRIGRQDVWNDLGETLLQAATAARG